MWLTTNFFRSSESVAARRSFFLWPFVQPVAPSVAVFRFAGRFAEVVGAAAQALTFAAGCSAFVPVVVAAVAVVAASVFGFALRLSADAGKGPDYSVFRRPWGRDAGLACRHR